MAGVVLAEGLAGPRPILVGAAVAAVQPGVARAAEVAVDALVGAADRGEVALAMRRVRPLLRVRARIALGERQDVDVLASPCVRAQPGRRPELTSRVVEADGLVRVCRVARDREEAGVGRALSAGRWGRR